jgi:hypothetical protein
MCLIDSMKHEIDRAAVMSTHDSRPRKRPRTAGGRASAPDVDGPMAAAPVPGVSLSRAAGAGGAGGGSEHADGGGGGGGGGGARGRKGARRARAADPELLAEDAALTSRLFDTLESRVLGSGGEAAAAAAAGSGGEGGGADSDGGEAPAAVAPPLGEPEGPAAAWHDSDDDAVMVDIGAVGRLRKLRAHEGERVISGAEYSRRLRRQCVAAPARGMLCACFVCVHVRASGCVICFAFHGGELGAYGVFCVAPRTARGRATSARDSERSCRARCCCCVTGLRPRVRTLRGHGQTNPRRGGGGTAAAAGTARARTRTRAAPRRRGCCARRHRCWGRGVGRCRRGG